MTAAWEVRLGDCRGLLAAMEPASVDAIVCDPPYNLGFMGREWDTKGGTYDAGFGYYLSGLIDGEGHFRVQGQHGDTSYSCVFALKMRRDDRAILDRAVREVGIGKVYDAEGETSPMSVWRVQSKADAVSLVGYLLRFPLRAKKARDFALWAEAVAEWTNGERGNSWSGPRDWSKLRALKQRLESVREYRDPPWSGNDFQDWTREWAEEALRVLKPGAHLVAFGGTRTYHRLTCALEDAGFEIRDSLMWLYGSGFPKSLDVSKAIDKRKDWSALVALQAKVRTAREALAISQSEAARRMGLIGPDETLGGGGFMWFETGMRLPTREQYPRLKAALGLDDSCDTAFEEAERVVVGARAFGDSSVWGSASGLQVLSESATENGQKWQGWGTALKPAYEPIVLARKPLQGTVAANVQAHGTGALNVDGCRIETPGGSPSIARRESAARTGWDNRGGGIMADATDPARYQEARPGEAAGRWPANVLLDEEAAALLDEQSGTLQSGFMSAGTRRDGIGYRGGLGCEVRHDTRGDAGGASRFFYTAKASSGERHAQGRNTHPTVKPVALMRWLCRLVTPPGGLIVDMFCGSGSTGVAALAEGFRFIGMEQDPESVATARNRIGGRLFAGAGA